MKKKLVIVLTLVLVIVVIKYFTGNYTITYKVGDYSVKEVVKDSDIYVEVTDKEGVIYNFLKNGKRNFTKKMVSKITSEDGCIKPNGFYYVCNSDTLEVKDLGVNYVKNLKDFNLLDEVLKNRIILRATRKLFGSTQGIEKVNIEDIIKLCNNNIGNKFLMPNKNLKVLIQNKKINFIKID